MQNDPAHRPAGDYIVDGNEATADSAYRVSEVISIYPITPASPMGEYSDEWAAKDKPNLWGDVPQVVEMQSEAGAAAAIHGSVQAGALATTFTASQGLLLMLPSMYKIAGELTPSVIHVSARTIATHALSIFGDHSDVYGARQTGFGLLASGGVQEAHDMALIAHLATLESRIPFVHFFDGFRTSHEMARIHRISDEAISELLSDELVAAHRDRALSPDHPVLRGTSHNPDTYFQARETINPYYDACPGIVAGVMDRFADVVGRRYNLFTYHGHPQAERVVILMGSGTGAATEMVDWLVEKGEKVGMVTVHLYRPFSAKAFLGALPETVKTIGVLDRSKEPGAPGEPMYLDVMNAVATAFSSGEAPFQGMPKVVGGRYGLSSKEFTPSMVKGVFDMLETEPRHDFTIGIKDDVTGLSVDYDEDLDIEPDEVKRAVFFGLGADGTVGANKNSIIILGEGTDQYAQGYFVYDSKKSGARTVSHLRFGPKEIRSTYLIKEAGFVAVHQWNFMEKYDVLEPAAKGATLLINSPYPVEEIWDRLPREVQAQIIEKEIKVHAVDAYGVAKKANLGVRTNTIMQTCFFALSGVIDPDEAIKRIKGTIEYTYGSKGPEIVKKNFAGVDMALANLHEVPLGTEVTSTFGFPPVVPDEAPDFVKAVEAMIIAGKGDDLPVSAFPVDGTWPTGTSRWEKRCIALEVPNWDESICIQCNKCAMVCPHAAIRTKVYDPALLEEAPEGFKHMIWKSKEFKGQAYTVQLEPDDCTGCGVCVEVCPAKDKKNPSHKSLDMVPVDPVRDVERAGFKYFRDLPELKLSDLPAVNVKTSQLLEPLFEASGACTGCGETPYVKLLTQLFGDRLLIGNATGCSSIYGGNLPNTPYCKNKEGRGPTWSNSLFEDAAEFSFGFELAVSQQRIEAENLVRKLASKIGDTLAAGLLECDQRSELGITEQRERIAELKKVLAGMDGPDASRLVTLADNLVRKSVWGLGGDGWAYDIGYGGLDHVVASGRDVNLLVLDTEVYSNTGGQQSKATPIGAVAKFAAGGRDLPKKDLGLLAMGYGGVYVAQIAFGAKDAQTVKAFVEAESYDGPSLVIAYSPCIAHGYDLKRGLDQAKLAVDSGHWPLYRFDPRRVAEGKSALQLDSGAPKVSYEEYAYNETRFRMLQRANPERAARLLEKAQVEVDRRFRLYQTLAAPPVEA